MTEPVTRSGQYKREHPEKAREYARRDNAKRNKAKQQWRRENRNPCVDCGRPTWRENRCRDCYNAHRTRQHEALLDRIEEMWNAGMLYREMAVALGRNTLKGVSGEIHELRRRGRIGYRYAGWERDAA